MMTRKSLFSTARFFVFLILAGAVSCIALPAEAQTDPTIEWIRIYKIPESALVAKSIETGGTYSDGGRRKTVAGVWPPAGFNTGGHTGVDNDGWREDGLGIVNGYVPIASDGTPVGCIEATPEMALKTGDILGIAIKIKGPVNKVGWDLEPNTTWEAGGHSGVLGNFRADINHSVDPQNIETSGADIHPDLIDGTVNISKFTLLYRYKVRDGDKDHDGGWFTNNIPFRQIPSEMRWGNLWAAGGSGNVASTVTYDAYQSIVYPVIDTDDTPKIVDATFGPEGTTPPGSTLDASDDGVVMLTSPYEFVSTAPHRANSLFAAIHEACAGVNRELYRGNPVTNWLRRFGYGDPMPMAGCLNPDAFALGSMVEGLDPKPIGFYGVGDTVEVSVAFTEPVVAHPDVVMILTFNGQARHAGLSRSTRSDSENKLYFGYTVQEGDGAFGSGISTFWPFAGRGEDANDPIGGPGNTPHLGAPHTHEITYAIQDLGGNPFTQIGSNSRGRENIESFRNYTPWTKKNWHGWFAHQVDGIRPSVALTKLEEGTDVTGDFTVDIKFYNIMVAPDIPSAPDRTLDIADDVADIDGADIRFMDAAGTVLLGAQASPAFFGYSYQPITREPRFGVGTPQSKVYRATLTPPLGFKGTMTIQVPAGVTMDIAGNENLASNVLTVPVDTRLELTKAPEIVAPAAGAYAAGQQIEVAMTYERENLRYVGENPPYLTLYLGDEVPANARHATWESAEAANSTKVTFTYTVAASDVAASVNVAPIGMTVPRGTILLDDSGQQLQGHSEPANESGEGLETRPPRGQGQLQLGESDQGLAPRTEVPVNLFIIVDETEPKSAATDVPRSPIVFNELGNGSGDTNDWLEFRNVTGSAVSLKEWELSVVQDGKKEDTSLIVFPDVSVPANGLLLITNSEPTAAGNVLAGGDDITTSTVEKEGSPHQYLVNAGLSLPDDGKFLLILRNATKKLGLDEAFVDVAGGGGSDTDAFIREQTGDYDTYVWPLQVLQAPGGDTEDALGSGKVWQRAKADIVGYHQDAWAEAAFTGIGYDRKVTQSAATAGTPGYPNGAVKPGSATPKGSVTFSEIMVDSAGGTLPQWIELYNKSKTDAINLNRWKLEIQNVDSEDLIGRPIVTLTLQEKVIQPNQTLLIVAGPARASSGAYLPPDRVYNLLSLHDKNLRIKRARDTFLSAEGIYLKLWDSTGTLVDEVGNTDGNRRTKDEPAWPLAMSAEEGVRSSLIRRYTDGTSQAQDGTEKGTWVLAANVKKVVDGELHWGAAEDIGTPGYRRGGALPVELSSFNLTRTEAGAVVVTWTTESEVDNAGFNLRRSETRNSGFTLINAALIAGAGTTGERQTYTFTDTSAKPGVEYYYQIEEVAFDGKPETLVTRMLPGPVSASNRALVTFGELKAKE